MKPENALNELVADMFRLTQPRAYARSSTRATESICIVLTVESDCSCILEIFREAVGYYYFLKSIYIYIYNR